MGGGVGDTDIEKVQFLVGGTDACGEEQDVALEP
jgi:hypothetical protein